MKKILVLACMLIVTMVFATANSASANGVVFYQNINYGGTATQPIPPGCYTLSQLQGFGFVNDWASSVQTNGYTVVMYANDNFGGQSWTLSANTPDFTKLSPNANDCISSVQIYKAGSGAVFYQNANYGGTATQPIPPGSYTLNQLQAYGFVNDWASSVKLNSGYSIIMYADDNFEGQSWTLTASNANFTTLSPNANDTVSSCTIYASGTNPATACQTVYPIVLSHGMGYTAGGLLGIGYWYNIPSTLTSNGANVFISNQTAMASTADRAAQLKTFVQQVLATTGASKVNIIGHSQGGLDARYMISNLGMAPYVASLTTVCSPNRGSSVADVLLGLNQDLGGWIADLTTDVYTWLFGGQQNSLAAAQYLSVSYMTNTFNPNTPNMSGVYYQSWSATIDFPCILDKTIFIASGALLYFYEGDNDGLVSTWSAPWGAYRGNQGGSVLGCGVSHVNMCDQFLGVTPYFDCLGFYVSMVNGLKSAGF